MKKYKVGDKVGPYVILEERSERYHGGRVFRCVCKCGKQLDRRVGDLSDTHIGSHRGCRLWYLDKRSRGGLVALTVALAVSCDSRA
jgi:hypothetical protein